MKLDRRQFLLLTTGLAAGCKSVDQGNNVAPQPQGAVNAGPAADYAADGVYSKFEGQGFFLIRRDGKLFALSSHCTHRKCSVTVEPDKSFLCECHGSTFSPDGHVTKGPAQRDLPVLPTSVNDRGQVIVGTARG